MLIINFINMQTNECDKQYCHQRKVKKYEVDLEEDSYVQVKRLLMSDRKRSHRSTSIKNETTATRYLLWIVCNCYTLNKTYEIFGISETPRAEMFLKALLLIQDDVFTRICGLQDVYCIFGANIHCHKSCINSYILKYQRKLD